MSRSWAYQIEAEDQHRDEGQVHEDQDPGAVEGEVRPTAEVPTTRSSTRMPARAASRTRDRTAEGRSVYEPRKQIRLVSAKDIKFLVKAL